MQSTFAEEIEAYKKQLLNSEDELGTPIIYIRVGKGAARVTRDRLGGTRRIVPTVESRTELKGSVTFEPSQQQREAAGVKGDLDCLIQIRKERFEKPINKVKDKFIIFDQEYRIQDFNSDLIAGSDIMIYSIGLISK